MKNYILLCYYKVSGGYKIDLDFFLGTFKDAKKRAVANMRSYDKVEIVSGNILFSISDIKALPKE